MDTQEVGKRLVELCRQGKNAEAIDTLYSKDIVSVEAMGGPDMPAESRGLEAVKGKNQWWSENHEIHDSSIEGPFPHNDRFAVKFVYDITPKAGPFQGKRNKMNEVAVYTVNDGKITREEFFYSM